MNKLNCVNATNGLRVYNDGTAMLCCMSMENLTTCDGKKAIVKTDSISSILNGKKAIEIKSALANGEKHFNCKRCWDEEDAGLMSKRIRDNQEYLIKESDHSLAMVELNLGTTCNLKCRICGPWSSSQWNKEFLEIKQWKGEESDYKKWLFELNHSYDDDSLFWSELKKNLHTIKKIEIYGGEPMLVKKQWELLQYAIDQGYSQRQKLHFNTNGTQFDWEKVNIMREFKDVSISISVDGLGKQFEYQRHPAVWSEVSDNIDRFKFLAEKYFWNLTICTTVNNHNIFYLDEVLSFFDRKKISIYLNFLHDPPRYNVKNLHEDIKAIVTDKYKCAPEVPFVRMWLKKATEYMNSGTCNLEHWNSFIEKTRDLDRIRSENFEKTFPEYSQLITRTNKEI